MDEIAKKRLPRIALAGNPNCGKTTLYNALTGSRQYVGNWPGVTVAQKSGQTKSGRSELVDLPGIYSLSPYSMEEIVARDYLVENRPDAIINIVDGTNLERNLYLTLQLLELGIPLVIAVNMMDDMNAKGWRLDCEALAGCLGVPVVPVVARKEQNTEEVLEIAEYFAAGEKNCSFNIQYDTETQNTLEQIIAVLRDKTTTMPCSFAAGKLLEGDPALERRLGLSAEETTKIDEIARRYEAQFAYGDRETLLADARYRRIEQIAKICLDKPIGQTSVTLSDRIDRIVTSRFLALPIFLLLLFFMFSLTFGPVGNFFSRAVEIFFSKVLMPAVASGLTAAAAPEWCRSLLVDAVLGGISGILVFLPQIALLFLCLSLLEDSGYMARTAFFMDRILHKLGLSGKSFIPMLMGFGCTTPAVMAARTMEQEKDRRMTIMLTPFMSCGARLPIYAMFAAVFFPKQQGIVVFSLYLLGILVAVLCGVLLKKTLFRGENAPFVMELPPYRMPTFLSVARHVWEKVRGFLIKAGTLIFAMSVLLWFSQTFTPTLGLAEVPSNSILGKLGTLLAPLFTPLGFGTWQAAVALLTGLIAKESVVSTLTVLYAGGSASLLPAVLATAFSPASALAFMSFSLLYMPCISAFAAIVREMNSLKWALRTALMQFSVAYVVSFAVYRLALLFL